MTEIRVTDLDISFDSMIGLVFKYWVASFLVWLMFAAAFVIGALVFVWLTH